MRLFKTLTMGLLFATTLGAQQTDRPPMLPADEYEGKVVFEVQHSVGGSAVLVPQTKIHFVAQRMKESGADIPEGTAICSIYKRYMFQDVKTNILITISLLKCGEYEYGVSEVKFAQ